MQPDTYVAKSPQVTLVEAWLIVETVKRSMKENNQKVTSFLKISSNDFDHYILNTFSAFWKSLFTRRGHNLFVFISVLEKML